LGKKIGIGLAAAVGYLAYRKRIRDWHLHWGATPDEVERTLPGDELMDYPDVVSTRVIAIDAPPSAVWPWLVQMGPGRGGAYTYDWIENLFGLGMQSADRVHPEWQHLEVGDTPSVKPGIEPANHGLDLGLHAGYLVFRLLICNFHEESVAKLARSSKPPVGEMFNN